MVIQWFYIGLNKPVFWKRMFSKDSVYTHNGFAAFCRGRCSCTVSHPCWFSTTDKPSCTLSPAEVRESQGGSFPVGPSVKLKHVVFLGKVPVFVEQLTAHIPLPGCKYSSWKTWEILGWPDHWAHESWILFCWLWVALRSFCFLRSEFNLWILAMITKHLDLASWEDRHLGSPKRTPRDIPLLRAYKKLICKYSSSVCQSPGSICGDWQRDTWCHIKYVLSHKRPRGSWERIWKTHNHKFFSFHARQRAWNFIIRKCPIQFVMRHSRFSAAICPIPCIRTVLHTPLWGNYYHDVCHLRSRNREM